MLKNKKIVIGITGGIAVYKICELVRLLKKAGADVRIVMTENARKFVTPLTFETLSGYRVYTDTFDHPWEIEHISLAAFADIAVIAPATANFIGKAANGIADDLLTTSLMAFTCPVLIAPAMNCAMWKNPAVTENCEKLKNRGYKFIGPASGSLACGVNDVGRMSEPAEIAEAIDKILNCKHDFKGKRVLITAGPTREMLDPVRFLSNRSTGKMGYAICEAALERGADVELVTGPCSLTPPKGASVHSITSTEELYKKVTELSNECDIVIQAAAPADFTPKAVCTQKIKKTGEGMTLELVSTPDIAKALGKAKRAGQILVAFAAETENCVENAKAKLKKKNADLIVLNDVAQPGAGFALDTNIVTIIDDSGSKSYPLLSKRDVADIILDAIAEKCNAVC